MNIGGTRNRRQRQDFQATPQSHADEHDREDTRRSAIALRSERRTCSELNTYRCTAECVSGIDVVQSHKLYSRESAYKPVELCLQYLPAATQVHGTGKATTFLRREKKRHTRRTHIYIPARNVLLLVIPQDPCPNQRRNSESVPSVLLTRFTKNQHAPVLRPSRSAGPAPARGGR